MEKKEYLGRGMKFPPKADPATGRFALADGVQSVRESIYLILMTQKTERMVRPSFGSAIVEYTFMDMSDTMLAMMKRDIRTDILTQEPRVSEAEISVDPVPDKGCLMVNISYTVAETNAKDNMVFPFYLNADTEGEGYEETDGIQTI